MHNELENMGQAQRILNAASKCISTRGYANVSLRDIADEAGVVLSQLNYYYKNKEGLLTEVIKMLNQKYLNEIEDILINGETEDEKISNLIQYFKEMLRNNPELFKLLFDLTSMALWSVTLKELLNTLFNGVTDLIQKHIIANSATKEKYRGYSPEALSRMILGSLYGISMQVILANEEEDMIDSLSTLKVLFERKY